jgi:hypothetical protein
MQGLAVLVGGFPSVEGGKELLGEEEKAMGK